MAVQLMIAARRALRHHFNEGVSHSCSWGAQTLKSALEKKMLRDLHRAGARFAPAWRGFNGQAPARFGSRQARSNGSRHACGAIS